MSLSASAFCVRGGVVSAGPSTMPTMLNGRRDSSRHRHGQLHEMNRALLQRSIVLAISAVAASSAWGQVHVLTHHNDNRRTGANLHETTLTVASVKQTFGKLWTLFADGQIVAQPLYVSGLNVDGRGTFNALIVSTMHNTIYAYDADKKPTLPQSQDALIWAQWLGEPQPENFGFDSWNTNFPEYGILSTPVINDAHTIMYVVSWHKNNGGQFRLHAIDLTKAPFPGPGFPPIEYREKITPVPVITASVPKPGGSQIKLDASQQKQRTALLLSDGMLYIGFSTNRETDGNLHGWLLAYDAATLKQMAVWNVTPATRNGGIWQAGSGPAADGSGNIYVMTGNGPFNANKGGTSYGDSFVKLRLKGNALAVEDYFTPCNQSLLDKTCGYRRAGAILTSAPRDRCSSLEPPVPTCSLEGQRRQHLRRGSRQHGACQRADGTGGHGLSESKRRASDHGNTVPVRWSGGRREYSRLARVLAGA